MNSLQTVRPFQLHKATKGRFLQEFHFAFARMNEWPVWSLNSVVTIMSNSYHWDRPPPGRTEHTWQAGQDKDNLQGHKLPDPLSTCPGGPAWCAAPAGCRSRWGPPGQSGGPARWGGTASASSHLCPAPATHLVPAIFAFLSNILLFHFTANINLTSNASHLIVKSKVVSFLSISFHLLSNYNPLMHIVDTWYVIW